MDHRKSPGDDGFERFLHQNFASLQNDAFVTMMDTTEPHSSEGSGELDGENPMVEQEALAAWLPASRPTYLERHDQQQQQQQQKQQQKQHGQPPRAPAAPMQGSPPVFRFGTPDAQQQNAAALGLTGSPALQETTKDAPLFSFQQQQAPIATGNRAGTSRRLMAVPAEEQEQKLDWAAQYQLLLQQRQQQQMAQAQRQQQVQAQAQRQRQRQQQQRQGRQGEMMEDEEQQQQQQQQQQQVVQQQQPRIKLEEGAGLTPAQADEAFRWPADGSGSPGATSPQQQDEQLQQQGQQQPRKPRRVRKPSQAQRDAHKRFRERRKEQVAALEAEVQQRMAQVDALTKENGALAAQERVLSIAVSASDANLMLMKQMSCLALKEEVGESGSGQLPQQHGQGQLELQQQQQGQGHPGLPWQRPQVLQLQQQQQQQHQRQGSGDTASSCNSASSGAQQHHATPPHTPSPARAAADAQAGDAQAAALLQQQQAETDVAEHASTSAAAHGAAFAQTASPKTGARSPSVQQQQCHFLAALVTVERLDRALVQPPHMHGVTSGSASVGTHGVHVGFDEGVAPPHADDVAWLQPLRRRLDVVVALYKEYLQQVSPLLLQAQVAAQPADCAVLSRIEELSLSLIGALRAWIVTNKVPVAYIQAVNMETGRWGELPPPDHWSKVVGLILEHMPAQQQADLCTMSQLFKTHMAKLVEERRVLMAQLQAVAAMQAGGREMETGMLHSAQRLGSQVTVREVLKALERNMRKERTSENMFIGAMRQLLDTVQLALVCVHSWPYWPYLPGVAAAVQQRLQARQQALEGGAQQQSQRHSLRAHAGSRGRKQ